MKHLKTFEGLFDFFKSKPKPKKVIEEAGLDQNDYDDIKELLNDITDTWDLDEMDPRREKADTYHIDLALDPSQLTYAPAFRNLPKIKIINISLFYHSRIGGKSMPVDLTRNSKVEQFKEDVESFISRVRTLGYEITCSYGIRDDWYLEREYISCYITVKELKR